MTLGGNLVKMGAIEYKELLQARNVKWLKLEQPNPDTLEVHLPPDEPFEHKIFKRSKGDFDCDNSGLKFSMIGSVYSFEDSSTVGSTIMTVTGLAINPGGAFMSAERIFRPLQDGSLSMEATDSGWGVWLIVSFHGKHNAFVHWQRYQPPPTNANSRSP
ncbi:MAG TPA: hypothetical protein VEG37_10095 [Burkholderiales bacterium]|nr:hypothetical protein [Burkholderiales bacterium]